jgi:hypothetical protein
MARMGAAVPFMPALGQAPSAPANVHKRPESVLTAADITYLGYINILDNFSLSAYGQGLTHRYVGGDLRFLTVALSYGGPGQGAPGNALIHEYSIAGKAFGSTVDTVTNLWNSPWGNIDGDPAGPRKIDGKWFGVWWDQAQNRLWTVDAIDYGDHTSPRQVQIFTRTLNADGTVSNIKGPVGLAGVADKRIFGGIQAVPSWFQTLYGTGPYVAGWGGYTSKVDQLGKASLGPTMYAIPDPAGFANGADIPANQFKQIMDCAVATQYQDWYLSGRTNPTTFDRGIRISPVTNYFDDNDKDSMGIARPNPSTPPTLPPNPGNWLSPAPDGYGRWVWGDSYWATGCWIDGPNKHGFLTVGTFGTGVCYYKGSTLDWEGRGFEFHIYDPDRLGDAVVRGRPTWHVKPTNLFTVASRMGGAAADLALGFGGTPNSAGSISAATFDPTTNRLYVMASGLDNGSGGFSGNNRLLVFSVNV